MLPFQGGIRAVADGAIGRRHDRQNQPPIHLIAHITDIIDPEAGEQDGGNDEDRQTQLEGQCSVSQNHLFRGSRTLNFHATHGPKDKRFNPYHNV